MRIGDLDALKEEMDRPFWEKWEWEFICKSIDNAPTIKTFTLLDIEEQYRKGLEKGLSEWETQRTQGEWIKDNSGDRFCSECGSCALYHEIGLKIESRFCPQCGADMRGKEE